MSSLPSSFSVAVDTRRRACVLDTHLALSPYGLLLAQRLSSELDLWLVRELWQILDNTHFYLSDPDHLRPVSNGAAAALAPAMSDTHVLRDTLTQWEVARTETDLAGLNLHWIGDALSESLLPARVDAHLVARFETLARSLDKRVPHPSGDRAGVLVDCVRDAVALTAALMPYRAFILTSHANGDGGATSGEPSLCEHLRRWGLPCDRLGTSARSRLERELMLPMFARAGVAELMWAGLELAAVHVLAPKAVMVPRVSAFHDPLDDDFESPSETDAPEADWWSGAVSFWYPLGADEGEGGH